MKTLLFTLASALIATQLQAGEMQAAEMRTGGALAGPAGPSALVGGRVARATLTTAVREREPIDTVSTLGNNASQIYYFTEIQGMAGQRVSHRWEYSGQIMAEVAFDIGGPRWRVFSSKTLQPDWLGDRKVSAIDASGNPLSVNTFLYTEGAIPGRAAAFREARTP